MRITKDKIKYFEEKILETENIYKEKIKDANDKRLINSHIVRNNLCKDIKHYKDILYRLKRNEEKYSFLHESLHCINPKEYDFVFDCDINLLFDMDYILTISDLKFAIMENKMGFREYRDLIRDSEEFYRCLKNRIEEDETLLDLINMKLAV